MRPSPASLAAIFTLLLAGACDKAPGPSEVEAAFEYPAGLAGKCPAEWPDVAKSTTGPALPGYQLRKPANYDARFAHPLLVVYAPSGARGEQSERYTHLTNAATSRGMLVAYADSLPMGLTTVKLQAGIVREVAKKWCVDPQRIYMSGHSDGGTISTALALLPESRDMVAAIAPSAAGFTRQDLDGLQCRPAPIPVMVMHGVKDSLFPGYGKQAAEWWAACNKCDAVVSAPDPSGCVNYSGCPETAPVMYCESSMGHTKWPGLENRIVEFLLGVK